MKTELSPAAQAVKDAALSMYADCNVRRMAWPLDMPVVTAALRAAADQAVPNQLTKRSACREHCVIGNASERIRTNFLAIATELEAQS